MYLRTRLTAAVAVSLLVACGGGDPLEPERPRPAVVKVVGDSLNDSGTFGYKFTVQGALGPYAIWTERVADTLQAKSLCPRYTEALVLKPATSDCNSYAVGGAAINPKGALHDATPLSVLHQLKDLQAQGVYKPTELLLVDGGGNDLAEMTRAHLERADDFGMAFDSLMDELLTSQEMGATDGTPAGIGGAYAVKLANLLADAITSDALNHGAQRVVVITAPDVARTPKFQAVLDGVKAGPGGAGAATAIEALVNQWTVAFNDQLKTRFAQEARVAVVDFYAEFNQWLDRPADFDFINASEPVCPRVAMLGGLPQYDISNCTDTALTALPPPAGAAGVVAWWKSYLFADDFHGTPRTNELMANLVIKTLEAKGWK